MNSDFSPTLQAELLDDFYAECDEQLGNLRAQLVTLESALARGQSDPAALESLYRSVHSFKGNAAIVGLTAAERLAHAAEGLLRSVTRDETPVTPDVLDRIGQAGHKLEQIVTAFRLKQSEPDASELLFELSAGTPAPAPGSTAPFSPPAGAAHAPALHDEPAPASMFIAPSHIVRADLGRLDELMRIAGEMVIQRSRMDERIARLGSVGSPLQEVAVGLARLMRELRTAITRVRLVPMAEIFSRLPFVVRDLGRDSGKRIRLVLEGKETGIDKYLVERLKEPLLHLVRNAVTHGIELPAERLAHGKPEEGTLWLSAAAVGDSVMIQIRDDGRGVDVPRVASRAAAIGITLAAVPDAVQLLDLLCLPGFSTRDEADRAAGRGVGMAVVRTTVRELGGTLRLETTPGQGTRFTLRLPVTLSVAETFIVSAGGQTCAVPQGSVEEIIQVPATEVRLIEGVEVVPYRAGLLPVVRLGAIFGAAATTQAHMPVLVVGTERGRGGLVVDRVHGQREVVVRPMQDPLIRVHGISGATELGDGRPVLILDAAALTSGASHLRPAADSFDPTFIASPQKAAS